LSSINLTIESKNIPGYTKNETKKLANNPIASNLT
jgi:hypothetical protein